MQTRTGQFPVPDVPSRAVQAHCDLARAESAPSYIMNCEPINEINTQVQKKALGGGGVGRGTF